MYRFPVWSWSCKNKVGEKKITIGSKRKKINKLVVVKRLQEFQATHYNKHSLVSQTQAAKATSFTDFVSRAICGHSVLRSDVLDNLSKSLDWILISITVYIHLAWLQVYCCYDDTVTRCDKIWQDVTRCGGCVCRLWQKYQVWHCWF